MFEKIKELINDKKITELVNNKKILAGAGVVSIVLLVGVVSLTGNDKKVEEVKEQNQTVQNEEEVVKKPAPLETKVTMVKKKDDNVELLFDLHEELDLNLQTGDDIFFRVVNKNNSEILVEKNKTWKEYILDEDNKKIDSSVLQPGKYKVVFTSGELRGVNSIDISINMIVKKDAKEVLNITSTVSTFGEDGHIQIESVKPETNEMGVRYKWQLKNPSKDRTNVKLTTFDGNGYLTSVDLNPGEVVSVYTPCYQGDKIKVHTRQLDYTYLIKDAEVDKKNYTFNKVEVENISGDSSTNGSVVRWKIKNPNANGRANVMIRDNVGGVIMQFDLDMNNEKVVDIDINRGRSIIVETRMGDGTYEKENYLVNTVSTIHDVDVNVLETIDNNGTSISKIEVSNVMNGKTNVVICTGDGINELQKFDLSANEKRPIDINSTYVESIMVKTRQFDGSYSEKVYTLAKPEL